MSSNDAQEALEALPSGLDDLVRKSVRKDLAWEWGDVHASRLVLEDVTERLKVRVASAHKRVAELECRDVRLYRGGMAEGISCEYAKKQWDDDRGRTYLAHDLIVRIHLTAESWIRRYDLLCINGGQDGEDYAPWVWGFRTSISRKLSGTLYISSI